MSTTAKVSARLYMRVGKWIWCLVGVSCTFLFFGYAIGFLGFALTLWGRPDPNLLWLILAFSGAGILSAQMDMACLGELLSDRD